MFFFTELQLRASLNTVQIGQSTIPFDENILNASTFKYFFLLTLAPDCDLDSPELRVNEQSQAQEKTNQICAKLLLPAHHSHSSGATLRMD